MIRKVRGKRKWRVYSRRGRNLGTYSSKKKAKKRLQQVEMFKRLDEFFSGSRPRKKKKKCRCKH